MQTLTAIESLLNVLVAASVDPQLTKCDLICLSTIIDAAPDTSSPVRLSLDTIAESAKISRRQAMRSVHRLVYLGYITRRSGDERTANTYTIRPHAAPTFCSLDAQGGARG